MAKIRPGGHGSYHPIGFEGREDTSVSRTFECVGFAEAVAQATDETIDAVNAAMRSAMNKVLKSGRTMVSTEIRNRYNVPKAVLDERLELFEGRMNNLQAVLTIGGRSIPLSYFGMIANKGRTRSTVKLAKSSHGVHGVLQKQTMKRSESMGISFEIIKGRRTTVTRSMFAAVMPNSGHIGVFHRGTGVIKGREKSKGEKHKQRIYENAVVSVATMFNQIQVNAAIVAKIDADLEATFKHELEFYLNRRK